MIGNHKALESFQNVIWITSIYMNTGKFWTNTLMDYYGAEKLRLCPEAAKAPVNGTPMGHQGNLDKVMYGRPYAA